MTAQSPRHILVYRDDRRVLDLLGRPGALVSLSGPPPIPGSEPVTHRFASATFLTPETEGELGELLRGAGTLDEFLDAIRQHGYRVEEAPGSGVSG